MQNKPGNTLQRAYSLGQLTTNQTRSGRLQPKDRNDFYTFSLNNRSSISLGLNGLKANADIKLLRSDRTLVGISRQPGKRSEQISATLDQGTYYLQVSSKGGKKGATSYTLTTAAMPILPTPATSPASTPSPAPSPAPAPVPAPPKQGKFRVSIRGFKVNNQTNDREGWGDGRHDEVFLRSQVYLQNQDSGILKLDSDRKSQVMGQMINNQRRGAGSGVPSVWETIAGDTTLGGLQTGDYVSGDTAEPGRLISTVVGRSLAPVWTGNLVSGQDVAYITPTIWETDRTTEPGNLSQSEHIFKTQNQSIEANSTQSLSAPGTASSWDERSTLFPFPWISKITTQSGRQLFGDQALGVTSSATGEVRPIGMQKSGNDYQFDPRVLPLTYEMADYISKNSFDQKELGGTFALRYADDASLGGDYTLYLRVERLSD
jgi:hypothetical protein